MTPCSVPGLGLRSAIQQRQPSSISRQTRAKIHSEKGRPKSDTIFLRMGCFNVCSQMSCAGRRRLWIIGMTFSLSAASLLAASGLVEAETSDDPILHRLANVDRFAFGGVGYAGVISQGEKDYRLVFARTSALADFERLFAVGNLQAKCYALAAIHDLDHMRFVELSLPLHDLLAQVETMSGCIVSRQNLSTIIARMEAGDLPRRRKSALGTSHKSLAN
jgi:hypothetical protein